MQKLLGLLIVGALLSFGRLASAGPLEDGVAAAKRGDHALALKLWRPIAELGDEYAQYNLGLTYEHGRGVRQDYREAMKWYRRAADQGGDAASGPHAVRPGGDARPGARRVQPVSRHRL